MKIPELLAPAGNIKNLRYALAYGADAVYAGLPRYSLRVRNNDFGHAANLAAGIEAAHAAGRRFFLAANILPHNAKVRTFLHDMENIVPLGPDALIISDPGLVLQVRERWPDLPVHLSVQANTMNYAAVRFWERQGVRRVILSRELSLDEIADIRQECPDMELETFVHGALCIAYSGRCLLSGYFNHRDANQGTCTNACRWQYSIVPGKANETGDGSPLRQPETGGYWFLEEKERPGALMPVEEDEHGTYIMNSKDLRAVRHIQRLMTIGVDSLKIEGRTKSHYYVARTTRVYRRAIDAAAVGQPFDPGLLEELENLANRGYTEGFFDRHADAAQQNYTQPASDSARERFVGEVNAYDHSVGMASIDVKNKFTVGDELVLITPTECRHFHLDRMEDRNGRPLQQAPGGGWEVRIPVPIPCNPCALLAVHHK